DHARGAGGGPDGGESPRSGHRGGVCGRRHRPMKRPIAELWGTGSYTPKRVLTNDEFSKILDTSDQWIRERTGIRERRVAGPDESNACMAKAAAEQVLQETGLTPLDIDALVVATCSPDRLLPSQACDLQALLGATLAQLLYRPGGGAAHPPDAALLTDHSYYIQMAGREVFKAAVLSMADACDKALERAGLTGADIDLLIPHQANIRIIEATAKHAGLPMDKVYVNVERYGNTSAASVAIALDEAVRCGRLKPGMKVMFCAFGAGFTWASLVVQW